MSAADVSCGVSVHAAWMCCRVAPVAGPAERHRRAGGGGSDRVLLRGERGGGGVERAGAAAGRLHPADGGGDRDLLRVPEEATRPHQLPRHPRLRRHTLLPQAAPGRRQIHPEQHPRGQSFPHQGHVTSRTSQTFILPMVFILLNMW